MEDLQIFCTIVQNTVDLAAEISSRMFNDITLANAQNVASDSRKESFRRMYNISKELDEPILLMWKRIRSYLLSMQLNCFSFKGG